MEIAIISILILLNGFFALAEIALISSRKTELESLNKRGRSGAKVALRLLENSENFLSAIQVGITLIGIVTGVYGGVSIAGQLTPFLAEFSFIAPYAAQIALTITVIMITYVSIVIGELVPKTIALSKPEKIAVVVAPIIYYFSAVFYPFVKVLSVSTSFINKILRVKKRSEQLTEKDLKQMIKLASHEGVIEEEQNQIHENVFYFSDKKAKHIMTHRVDTEWIDISKTQAEVHYDLIHSTHTKILACQKSLDDFVGYIVVQEYLKKYSAQPSLDIMNLVYEPVVVPENSDAQKVMQIFRQTKKYFAVVVDEYGSMEGIITLHDILEGIFGSIPDENEPTEPDVFIRDDKSFLVNGEAFVETLKDIIDDFVVEFDKIDYSTVAGFVLSHINKIPQVGDKFQFQDYIIEVVDVDGRKVDKVLIRRSTDNDK